MNPRGTPEYLQSIDPEGHAEPGSALVVGGSRGLGLAIASHLAAAGRAVTVWSRTPPPRTSSPNAIRWIEVDVGTGNLPLHTLPGDLGAVYSCAAQGVVVRAPSACSTDALRRMVDTNFIGGAAVLLQLIDALPAGGRFAHISSLTARLPSLDWCVYGATKAALEHLVDSVQPWAKERGVTVTLCYPGALDTTFHAAAGGAVPGGAVDPRTIVAGLVRAVDIGLPWYVAPMDEKVLATLGPRRTVAVDAVVAGIEGLR